MSEKNHYKYDCRMPFYLLKDFGEYESILKEYYNFYSVLLICKFALDEEFSNEPK